jgi:hypothetical protein
MRPCAIPSIMLRRIAQTKKALLDCSCENKQLDRFRKACREKTSYGVGISVLKVNIPNRKKSKLLFGMYS